MQDLSSGHNRKKISAFELNAHDVLPDPALVFEESSSGIRQLEQPGLLLQTQALK